MTEVTFETDDPEELIETLFAGVSQLQIHALASGAIPHAENAGEAIRTMIESEPELCGDVICRLVEEGHLTAQLPEEMAGEMGMDPDEWDIFVSPDDHDQDGDDEGDGMNGATSIGID